MQIYEELFITQNNNNQFFVRNLIVNGVYIIFVLNIKKNIRIMNVPKVSVIMPVYNTAQYLKEALDSICTQSLYELQIIIVDDGSTDNSPQILNEYQHRDNRIEIITQVNQGQGAARNRGLDKAVGEFIYFMDSDDILDKICLATCYKYCCEYELDYVVFDAKVIYDYHQDLHLPQYERKERLNSSIIWNSSSLLVYMLENHIFYPTVWLYFFRRELVQKEMIQFPCGVIHEDNAFVVHLMLSAQNVRYLPYSFFKRRIRQNSTMTSNFSMRNIVGYLKVFECLRLLMLTHVNWKPIIELYLNHTINALVWQGHRLSFMEKLKTFISFHNCSLIKYASIKNWIVFWLKPAK